MTKTGENFRSGFVYFACLYMLEKVHSSKKIIVKCQMISTTEKTEAKSIDENSAAKKKPETQHTSHHNWRFEAFFCSAASFKSPYFFNYHYHSGFHGSI